MQFCPTEPNTPPGEAPTCDPLEDKQYAILSYDFGSLRQPVVFQFWLPSVLLFGLSLLGLHWYELDAAQAQAGERSPSRYPRPAPRRTPMFLAQQLIDASKDGGAAFLAFAIMVFLFAGSLFYMDKVRRRRESRTARRRSRRRGRRKSSTQSAYASGARADRCRRM